jgi:hypothetical protein
VTFDDKASVEAASNLNPHSHPEAPVTPQNNTAQCASSLDHGDIGPAEAKEPRRQRNPLDGEPEPRTKAARASDGRWVKGSSGNPKGRPKVPRTYHINDRLLRESFLAQMLAPVSLRMKGKPISISTASAIITRQIQDALQGKRLAAKWVFEHFQNYVNDHEQLQAYWADVAAQHNNRIMEEIRGTPEEALPLIMMPPAPDTAPAGRRGRSRKR